MKNLLKLLLSPFVGFGAVLLVISTFLFVGEILARIFMGRFVGLVDAMLLGMAVTFITIVFSIVGQVIIDHKDHLT